MNSIFYLKSISITFIFVYMSLHKYIKKYIRIYEIIALIYEIFIENNNI